MSEKKDISFEIYSNSEKMLEQIVEKYDLPDQSKALRCLLDYAEEKRPYHNSTYIWKLTEGKPLAWVEIA